MSNDTVKNKKSKIPGLVFRAAAVLLAAVLAVCLFSGTLAAKYSKFGSAGDGARTARFSVNAGTAGDTDIKITELNAKDTAGSAVTAGTADYSLTVSNSSEVAVRYTVKVTLKGNTDFYGAGSGALVFGNSLSCVLVDENSNEYQAELSEDGLAATFSGEALSFAAGEASKSVTLRFGYDTAGAYIWGTFDFDVDVCFEQID